MNEDKNDAHLKVIDALYDAVLDESMFLPAIAGVGSLTGCEHGTVLGWNTQLLGAPTPLGFYSSDPGRFAAVWNDYAAHFLQFDPTREIAGRFRDGWFIDSRDMTVRERERNPMLQDLLRSHGYAGWAALEVKHGHRMWALSFEREAGSKDFAPADQARVDRVVPHLCRALAIREHIGTLRQVASIGLGALDLLSLPVWIVEGSGKVLFSNRASEALLRMSASLFIAENGCLRPAHDGVRLTFAQLLAEASAEHGKRAGALNLRRSNGGNVAVQVLPMPPQLAMASDWQRPLAMVVVHLHETPKLGTVLQALYGFTPAEVRLAVGLMADQTLDELAERFFVKVSTVRMQVKSMLAKTDCRRQAEMVRLFTSLSVVGDSHG